jgi:hypothetical protein
MGRGDRGEEDSVEPVISAADGAVAGFEVEHGSTLAYPRRVD